jgi:hypothetical protein
LRFRRFWCCYFSHLEGDVCDAISFDRHSAGDGLCHAQMLTRNLFLTGVFVAAMAAHCMCSFLRRLRASGYFLHDRLCVSGFVAILGSFQNKSKTAVTLFAFVCHFTCLKTTRTPTNFVELTFQICTKLSPHSGCS